MNHAVIGKLRSLICEVNKKDLEKALSFRSTLDKSKSNKKSFVKEKVSCIDMPVSIVVSKETKLMLETILYFHLDSVLWSDRYHLF